MFYLYNNIIAITLYLEISEFWEGVYDDTKDDVESNSCDEDEEGKMEDHKESKPHEGVLCWMARHTLKMLSPHHKYICIIYYMFYTWHWYASNEQTTP